MPQQSISASQTKCWDRMHLLVVRELPEDVIKVCLMDYIMGQRVHLLPTGSEEREVLGVGSIPVAILPS